MTRQAVCPDGIRLPFERKRRDRVDLDRPSREAAALLADQDLPRLRGLLEARRDVDGIARGEPLLGARHDLARIDAGAELQRDAIVALELSVEGSERVAELGGSGFWPFAASSHGYLRPGSA